MPVKYAIRSRRSINPTRGEVAELERRGYRSHELSFEYEEVPYMVADMDKANGVYAVFSHNDVKISDWTRLARPNNVEEAYAAGRKRSGPVLKDSIGQDISPGDYVMSHDHSHRALELNKVIRNLKVKTVTEEISGLGWPGESVVRSRNTDVYIRIPNEMIEGGELVNQRFTKKYAVREYVYRTGKCIYVLVGDDEDETVKQSAGYFGYFDDQGNNITGWISLLTIGHDNYVLDPNSHSNKKIVQELDTPMTDAMGTDIFLGDWVFSDDNHYNNFMLSRVIGFSKDRVRLAAYSKNRFKFGSFDQGERIITLNWAKNIIKLPVEVIE